MDATSLASFSRQRDLSAGLEKGKARHNNGFRRSVEAMLVKRASIGYFAVSRVITFGEGSFTAPRAS